MKICFLTIVLDGQPFISHHYPEFKKLDCDWEWRLIEGVAAPVADTGWVKSMTPRLSQDGTKEYLDSLAAFDPRVILFRKALWPGKVSMLNEALKTVSESCLLMEIDSDEMWTADQITKLRQMFIEHPEKNSGRFRCRFFVGRNLTITNTDQTHYGNMPYEWNRAWLISPGARFSKHEPPVLESFTERPFTQEETAKAGLIFDHHAYSTEAQVAFKVSFYGSANNPENGHKYSLEGWKKLQANQKWPVANLAEFLPWVGPGVTADRV